MITGMVNSRLEARIQLEVHGPSGQTQQVEAVIDTGSNGHLTLPTAVLTSLGATWASSIQGMLADGSVRAFDVIRVVVEWDGRLRSVEVEAVDSTPLVGTDMLHQHELRVAMVPGGAVTITQLP